MSQKRPQHDRSKHLKDNENNNLIQIIEKEDGVTLATAAIQLWLSQKPNHITWNKNVTGIICFVKDYAKKSYFFRLYSLTPSYQLWEQEMYTPFSYNQLTKNFHYFASDVCNAGFNFAFEDEAEKFYNTVNNKIMTKTKKSGKVVLPQTKNNNYSIVPTGNHNQISSSTSNLPNYSTNITLNAQHSTTSLNSRNSDIKSDKNVKKTKKTGIDKSMISGPTGFRVVQHVGLNNNSFEINLQQDEQSKKMKEFLSELNLDSIPVSKKTKAFVESYVKDHGGLDRFSEELKKQKAPAPTQSAPTLPSQFNTNNNFNNNNFGNNNRQIPPPQVNNQQQHQQVRPPPINRSQNIPPSVPPPPPPPLLPPQPQYAATSQVLAPAPIPPPLPASKPTNFDNNRQFLTNDISPLPQPRIKDENNASNESTPVVAGPPAPPPPPPPPPPPLAMFQATSTPPPVLNTTPTINVSKILNGSPSPINSSSNDSRNNLLESIKGFSGFSKTLTPPAQPQTNRNSDIPSQQLDSSSIVDQLKNELLKRAQFLNDSSDGDDDESDSEWQ